MASVDTFAGQVTPLIITFNEQANISRTLAALKWARDIVVIDSGSTDDTLAILAADPRIRVLHRAFDTFAGQCNFGLDQVRTEWVLSIDADYEITSELSDEVAALDPAAAIAGFRASFIYCVFGRPLPSTLYPPRTVLYRVARGRYEDDGHGHRVVIAGDVHDLSAKIRHDDRKPIGRWFRSQIGYAAREAEHLLAVDPVHLKRLDRIRRMGWPAPFMMLAYTLFWRRYALAGRAGLYYSFQRVLAEMMLAIEINDRRLR